MHWTQPYCQKLFKLIKNSKMTFKLEVHYVCKTSRCDTSAHSSFQVQNDHPILRPDKMLTLCYRKFGITISNDIAPILPKKELLYFDYALIREPPLSNEHKIK